MSWTFEEAARKIKRAYAAYYILQDVDSDGNKVTLTRSYIEDQDIDDSEEISAADTIPEDRDGMFLYAEFHMHSEQYLLSKKAQLYQMDTNEYVYFFYFDHLTKNDFDECVNKAHDLGFPKIVPGKDHRSSFISAIFICNTCDEDALTAVRKYRRRKSFQFSLNGWMEVHTALIDLRSESIWHNGDGRQEEKFLKNILHPQRRRKKFLFL